MTTPDSLAWMERHDLIWKEMPLCRPESPESIQRGAFLGNGILGAVVFGVDEPCDFPHHALQVDIGRADVADTGGRRSDGSEWWDKWDRRHKGTRLHTGGFRLLTRGLGRAGTMRLDLANAECRVELATRGAQAGRITARALVVAATDPVIAVEVHGDGIEARPRWVRRPMSFPGWPPPRGEIRDGIQIETQPLLDGQEYAVAWTEVVEPCRVVLLVAVGVSPRIKRHSRGQDDGLSAGEEAFAAVATARAAGLAAVADRHRAWWREFHGRSRVWLPDARLEGFYAISTYTLGCTARRGAPFPDMTGPWSYAMGGCDEWAHCPGYPHIWLNFNAQYQFLLPLASNHAAECGEVLLRSLALLGNRLLGPAPAPDAEAGTGGGCGYDFHGGEREERVGCHLIWLLQTAWLTCRYGADAAHAAAWQGLVPLLAGAVNELLARTRLGRDGRYHIHESQSPEYPATPEVPQSSVRGCTDACYELAILRWGLMRLLADLPRDSRAVRWRDVLDRLADYPQDPTGLRIAREVPSAIGHRHYSHLLMAWPLREWLADDDGQRTLILRTMATWLSSPPDGKGPTGFTWGAAAALAAHCRRGDLAWGYLNTYFDETPIGLTRRFRNTLAREWGMALETPLGAANAVLEMLLQSHGGRLRVFPAMPAAWAEAQFVGLAAEGGFVVSARRQEGRTAWITVLNPAGGTLCLDPGIEAPVVKTSGGMQVRTEDGFLVLSGPAGSAVTVCRAGVEAAPADVSHRFHAPWHWGEPEPGPRPVPWQ